MHLETMTLRWGLMNQFRWLWYLCSESSKLCLHANHTVHTVQCRYKAVIFVFPLQWRHNGRNGVSNHQPPDSLLNRLFRHRSKKTSKLRVTCLCEGNSLVTSSNETFPTLLALCAVNSPVTGKFPSQRTNDWVNNRDAGDLTSYLTHYDVILMNHMRNPGDLTYYFQINLEICGQIPHTSYDVTVIRLRFTIIDTYHSSPIHILVISVRMDCHVTIRISDTNI